MRNREPDADLDQLAHSTIGAAIEVHRVLGPGFIEKVYEEALCVELEARRIPYDRQYSVGVNYKGRIVGEGQLDILIDKRLILELKAVESLLPVHTAQLLSYLKTTGYPLGLLINFNVPILKQAIKRIVLSK